MNLLIDTHVLLWWLDDAARIGPTAAAALKNSENSLWVSSASVWEISIKSGLELLKFSFSPEEGVDALLEQGFRPLPIEFQHALAVRRLPLRHRDPFDRMLIAQAQCEGLTIMTVDSKIRAYGVPTFDASI